MVLRFIVLAILIFISACDHEDVEARELMDRAETITGDSADDELPENVLAWRIESRGAMEIDELLRRHSTLHTKLDMISAKLSVSRLDTAILAADAINGGDSEAGLNIRTAQSIVGTLDMKDDVKEIEAEFDRFDGDWESLREKLHAHKETAGLFDAAERYLDSRKTLRLAKGSLLDATLEGEIGSLEDLHSAKAEAEKANRAAESEWRSLKEKLTGLHRLRTHEGKTSTK